MIFTSLTWLLMMFLESSSQVELPLKFCFSISSKHDRNSHLHCPVAGGAPPKAHTVDMKDNSYIATEFLKDNLGIS